MSDKRIMKRAVSVLAVAAVVLGAFGFVSGIHMKAYAASSSGDIGIGADKLKDGENTANARLVHMGDRLWYVIGYDGEGVSAASGEICLIAKDSIKTAPFDKEYREVYRDSQLRKEIDAYVNEKFSDGEKAAVIPKDLPEMTPSDSEGYKWWVNHYQTIDAVQGYPVDGALLWPLGVREACAVTGEIRKIGMDYWLRTMGAPGYYYDYVIYDWDDIEAEYRPPAMAIVKADGSVAIQSENSSYWKGVRPAFKLRKSDVVLTSASADGSWKLTLRDEAHQKFYVNPCDVEFGESGSIKLKYSDARTGENEYISAIIEGADGSVKQYERVAKVTEASGIVTIRNLPKDASGRVALDAGDQLYVFNEQYNGDGKTDYASDLKGVSLTGHNWVFDNLHYDTRSGETTAEYHCSIDGNHFKAVSAEYGTERIPPTCEEKGKEMEVLSISADKSLDGKEHKKSKLRTYYADALGHDYKDFSSFRWTGTPSGYTKAEAVFKCTRDPSHKTYINVDIREDVKEPTCEFAGRSVYQAFLPADKSLDGKWHGDAKNAKPVKRLGHDWEEPTYEWSADGRTVTAKRVCKRDASHVETETVETERTIETAPTCKDPGKASLIKTKPFSNSAFQEQTKTDVTIPADPQAHVWSEEGEKQGNPNSCGGYVTVFKCKLCDEENEEVIGGDNHQWTENKIEYAKPTCTEMGEKMYQCTKCQVYDLESMETIDPTGHKWKFVDFTWTGNEKDGYGMAVANYVCEHDASHKMTSNATITEEVIDPTCKEGGKTVCTASISASDSPDEREHSESKDAEKTDAVGHDWEYAGMEWTGNEKDGYTKAAAKYACKYDCGNTEAVDAQITENETKADCEHEGKTTYTAEVTADESLTGEAHKESKSAKVTKALGHSWHLKDIIWTGDEEKGYTKAEAEFVCNNDASHTRFVQAKMTEEVTEPTCVEEGYTMYLAKVTAEDSPNGSECVDVNYAKFVKATGHDWEFKGFTWKTHDEYGYAAAAEYVCRHDKNHAQTAEANIRIEKIPVTCEEPGGTRYTATVKADERLTDEDVQEEKFIKESEATGHKWEGPSYTWADDDSEVTAKRVCTNCDTEETETVKPTSTVIKEANCREKGEKEYAASFKNKAFEKQTKTVEIPVKPNNHKWDEGTPVEGQEICGGQAMEYTCEICGETKIEGNNPKGHVWEDEWMVFAEPTCTEQGERYHKCKNCDALNLDEIELIPALGHDWGEASYEWSSDNSEVTATRVCRHDKTHEETETVNTTIKTRDATCEEKGETAYIAEFKNGAFAKQTRTEEMEAKGHDWSEWKVTKEATTEAEGEETRVCSACGKEETRSIKKLDPKPEPEPTPDPSAVKSVLVAKGIAKGQTSVRISWNKVKDADRYVIYLSKCNYKGKSYTPKKVKSVKAGTQKWTGKKLKKNTAYKFYVVAQQKSSGSYKTVAKSRIGHFFTGNSRGKYTNPKSLKLKKSAYALKKGKSAKIKASVAKVSKGKKLATGHAAKLRFISNNPKVAAVGKSGRITAKSSGKAVIYVQTINGIWKTCKITVQ